MMIWLYAIRFPALARKGISLKGRVGSKGGDLDGVVEPQVQWKAHNYNHLMEQPTLFYAIAITLALIGGGDIWINVWLAWAYVGFRVLHSLDPGDDQRGALALPALRSPPPSACSASPSMPGR